MKLWIDDVRPAPEGYIWHLTTNGAIAEIRTSLKMGRAIELLDIDHDAGDWVKDGGDYIQILNWMEENGISNIPIRIHSMNPVGVQNMRAIIQKNNWKEVK